MRTVSQLCIGTEVGVASGRVSVFGSGAGVGMLVTIEGGGIVAGISVGVGVGIAMRGATFFLVEGDDSTLGASTATISAVAPLLPPSAFPRTVSSDFSIPIFLSATLGLNSFTILGSVTNSS